MYASPGLSSIKLDIEETIYLLLLADDVNEIPSVVTDTYAYCFDQKFYYTKNEIFH